MYLGSTNLDFTFVIDGIKIERRDNIDSRLCFDRHITNICSKVNNQLQVMRRFKNLVSKDVRARLYLLFFQYCSAVWHFCEHVDVISMVDKSADRMKLMLICFL